MIASALRVGSRWVGLGLALGVLASLAVKPAGADHLIYLDEGGTPTSAVKQWVIQDAPVRWCSDDNGFYSANAIAPWESVLPGTDFVNDCGSVNVWIRSYVTGDPCGRGAGAVGCFASLPEWDSGRGAYYVAGANLWLNDQYYNFPYPEGRQAIANHEVGHLHGLHERYCDSPDPCTDGDSSVMDFVWVDGANPPNVLSGRDSNVPTANDIARTQSYYSLSPASSLTKFKTDPDSVNWYWTDSTWAESYYLLNHYYSLDGGVSWIYIRTDTHSGSVGPGQPDSPRQLFRSFDRPAGYPAADYMACIQTRNEVYGSQHWVCTPSEFLDVDSDGDGFFDATDNCPTVNNTNQANNRHPDTPPGDACDDPDNDVVFDGTDNCPDWHNPAQNLPAWPIATNDLDCDGFSAALENYVGTAPSVQCGKGAWPPDFDNDTFVGGTDSSWLNAWFGKAVPPAPARLDIAPDPPAAQGQRYIDSSDQARLNGFFGQSCGSITSYGYYHPVTPARIRDTRDPPGIKVGAGGEITVDVTGIGGVPTTGVTAVVVNVAVDQPTASSYLTVYPSGQPRPSTTNLNFGAGQTIGNQATVGVGSDGNIRVYNLSGQTHVIIDVAGWYGAPNGGSRYNSLTPKRILDTRNGIGAPTRMIGSSTSITVDVTDTYASGVPASGVTAVVLHVAVDQPTSQSHLTVYPAGAPRPNSSNLNFLAGTTVSNLVIVKVGSAGAADGKVNVRNDVGSTHVIFDVVGWYGGASGDVFHLVTPSRILDTRPGEPAPGPKGKVGPNANILVDVTGVGTIPASGASAVVVNAAVTQPTAASYLTIYPSDVNRPDPASSLNFAAQQTVANLEIVKVGADGNVKVWNSVGQTHVIFDAVGFFGTCNCLDFTPEIVRVFPSDPPGGATFNADLWNRGDGGASGATVFWCLDHDPAVPNPLDPACPVEKMVGFEFPVGMVPPNSFITVYSQATNVTPGSHTIYFCADTNTQFSEINEANNCRSESFTVP
jgi:hypothetical protein